MFSRLINLKINNKGYINRIKYSFNTIVNLSQKQYLSVATKKIHQLTQLIQKLEQTHQVDISSSDQILKINLNKHSIVINTQTPNRQLWYSCTKSGPQRFDYIKNTHNQFQWVNNKGQQLSKQLQNDINSIVN